jgi:DNA-binding CsgD family transcriptional regulator
VQIQRLIPLVTRLLAAPRVMALPTRERQVCLALAQGLSTAQTAERLGIQPSSVITHIRLLYRRLGIARREDLVAAALA